MHRRNAYALVRPPGHHAERDRAMGFCFVNNIAVAAAHARSVLGLERVAIVVGYGCSRMLSMCEMGRCDGECAVS